MSEVSFLSVESDDFEAHNHIDVLGWFSLTLQVSAAIQENFGQPGVSEKVWNT